MKFFSNEKENETQEINDRDRAATDPAVVPPQRAGSPWSDAPGESAPASASASASGDTSTDAVPASSTPADRDGFDESSKTATTYGPDGTVVEDGDYRGTHAGDSDSTQVISTADSAKTDDAKVDEDKVDEDKALKDDGTFDSPKAVDPATDLPLDDGKADDYRDGEEFQPTATPVAAAAAVPATTPAASAPAASSPAASGKTGERLLPDGDSFAERFRDIQLRFVDEPKEATAEAAQLVEEAVDKLTSALKSQRDSLGGNADDTEKLRVELRAYRDIINRLTAL
ncbi:hypothetical protein [Paractinoplanes lichenicola]|uniref:Uncharacterized protein n=1 Tax=Paractinoplanes lichenicola TaxID=2802976 RepID=A0ABS1W118_9ACTN|nr:hypothetical protein [Actinoplanes lichenicola]MBL7260432.1 hypothetical protein [Actinoplanes lichenicola]